MAGEKDLLGALTRMLRVNLGVKGGETALVFTDLPVQGGPGMAADPVMAERRAGLVRVARAAAQAAGSLGLKVRYLEFPELSSHGSEPDEGLWRLAFGDKAVDELKKAGLLDAIRDKKAGPAQVEEARAVVERHKDGAVDAVVALSHRSTSHTRFRDLLTSQARARYASMPLFEEDMLWGSMDVDWDAVAARSAAVAGAINGAESVRVTTRAGTDITMGIRGRTAREDTGLIGEPGSFSNLPAGEVYLAPVEGTSEGVLLLEWAPNRRLASPVRVTVRAGMVESVEGGEPYVGELLEGLNARPDNRNIAELGIGTNDKAARPDNVLESEKILGTVHIAFGDNTSMGGVVSTPFHQDFVFFGPTLTVVKGGAETVILKDGRMLAG